jgi:hypothetical protein
LWLHSLKVAQLLRNTACLHTNQSRSYLNHLVSYIITLSSDKHNSDDTPQCFTDVHNKVRPNLHKFSRNSKIQNCIMCSSLIPIFTKIGQQMWKMQMKFHSLLYVKYDFHLDNSHETHSTSVATCADHPCQVSPRSVRKYGKFECKFMNAPK